MAPIELTMELFSDAVSLPDGFVDLVEGALLIAQAEYPQLDRTAYHTRLAAMAREAGRVCTGEALERIGGLNRLLFERWGFHGNHDDYYDCRNSYLNDVLDLRTGIPITLSIVYIEVGRGAGLDLTPVGLPGHFLVGIADGSDLFVDTFSEGTVMSRADCIARFGEMHPGREFRPEYLAPAGRKQVLSRMLNNLFAIHADRSRFEKALTTVDMMIRIDPAEAELLRRRSVVNQALKRYSQAIGDLESYLERCPEAPDSVDLHQRLTVLRNLRNTIN